MPKKPAPRRIVIEVQEVMDGFGGIEAIKEHLHFVCNDMLEGLLEFDVYEIDSKGKKIAKAETD